MVSSDPKKGKGFHLCLDEGYDDKAIRKMVEAWVCESIAKCSAIDRHDLNLPRSFLRFFAPRQNLY